MSHEDSVTAVSLHKQASPSLNFHDVQEATEAREYDSEQYKANKTPNIDIDTDTDMSTQKKALNI